MQRSLQIFLLAATLAATGCHKSDYPLFPEGFREFAYVTNSGSNTVTVLDLVYLRTDRTLLVGNSPIQAVPNPRKQEVYILNRESADANGSLSIIDTASNQVVATIPLRRGSGDLSVEPSGHLAFIANTASNNISVINLDSRSVRLLVLTASGPASALIARDARSLLVVHPGTGTVSLYAVDSSISDPKLNLRSTYTGCPGATSPVILPDSSKAFIACPASNQVLVLSLAAAPSSWAVRHDASLAQDHLLAQLDVGLKPTFLTLKPDGGEIFVSNLGAGSISEISTPTNEVTSTFGIGDLPSHGIVSGDNSALWISNAGADALSLYSIDDGKRLPSLHVGAAPDALAFTTGSDQHFLLVADRRSGDVAVIRNSSSATPRLLTMLPAGPEPSSIAIKSNSVTP